MGRHEAPNIVLVFADQLRRDALGCYGNRICRTPNIDRLAAESMLFDQAYTTSPVCSPARVSLLTGLYPICVNLFNRSRRQIAACFVRVGCRTGLLLLLPRT